MLSVSPRTVATVKAVQKQAPELIQEIEKGNLNAHQAQQIAKLPEPQRAVVLPRVVSGESVATAVREVKSDARKAEKPKPKPSDLEKKAQSNMPKLFLGKAENCPFIPSGSIDVIICSPPYNMGGDRWPMGGGGRKVWDSGIAYDSTSDTMPLVDYVAWQIDVLKEMFRVATDGASFFYNHKNRTVDGELISPLQWLLDAGNPWTVRQEIVWDRVSTHNHSASLFWPIDERIYWMTKGKPNLTRPIGLPSVWKEFGPTPNTWHPAPFTEKLPEMVLTAVGFAGCVVLDPFAGSGSTLKAAQRLGFDSIGIDISAEYLTRVSEENEWTM
jgi:site-specific DNA-methyltransferase (adenine-specific)